MYPRRANKNYCSKILRTQKRMNSSTFIRRIAKNISFILQINVFLFYPTSKTYDMPINMLRMYSCTFNLLQRTIELIFFSKLQLTKPAHEHNINTVMRIFQPVVLCNVFLTFNL
ncbi:unnamed protein product [Rotaria magnacalcarata]